MKKLSLLILSVFTAVSLALVQPGCCKELLSLADLLISAFEAPGTVTVGSIATATGDVFNSGEQGLNSCSETNISDFTNLALRLYRVIDPNAPSTWVLNDEYLTDLSQISPDDYAQFLSSFTIPDNNLYAFYGMADYAQACAERDEDNNDANANRLAPDQQLIRDMQTNNCIIHFVRGTGGPDNAAPGEKARFTGVQVTYHSGH